MTGRLGARLQRARALVWPALPVVLATAAAAGGLSDGRIFYARDLSFVFWQQHLWTRAALRAGRFPVWDPTAAFGQSPISDPVRLLLFPPVALLRLLFPAVLGFNLCVLLPFPTAGLGVYLLLRRTLRAEAACLGGIVFALSGPMLSTGNAMNFAWSAALAPWVLLCTHRLCESPSRRRFAALAAVFALQFLAGEAVTLVATSALAVAYAALGPAGLDEARSRARAAALVVGAGATAVLLGAAQTLPLFVAVGRSARGAVTNPTLSTVWSMHPAALAEFVAPQIFGDPLELLSRGNQWLAALNSGRAPFVFSVYLGCATLALALAGALRADRRRYGLFWAGVFVAALVCALGVYTPVYPLLQQLAPPLRSLRYPSKYTVVVALAAAALAASGWEALAEGDAHTRGRAGVVAALGFAGSIAAAAAMGLSALVFLPSPVHAAIVAAADRLALPDAGDMASLLEVWLFGSLSRALAVGLAALGGVALGASARRESALARWALFGVIAADLLAAGVALNPTGRAVRFDEPAWAAAIERKADRVYVGGRLSRVYDHPVDEDDPVGGDLALAEDSPEVEAASANAFLTGYPGAWGVRESISIDTSLIWPRAYGRLVRRLRSASHEERVRVLSRLGVRHYLVPWQSWPQGRAVAHFPERGSLTLYERDDAVPRAYVAAGAEVIPDADAQISRLFAEDFDPRERVLLAQAAPEPAGGAGEPRNPAATIIAEGDAWVRVVADVPEGGGYLVLTDSYDPDWTAKVDGTGAPVLEANGLFRAIRLTPGRHEVDFELTPREFLTGLCVSAVTAALLLLFARRRAHAER